MIRRSGSILFRRGGVTGLLLLVAVAVGCGGGGGGRTIAGTGTFTPAVPPSFPVPAGPENLAVGDIDGDGVGDLAVSSRTSALVSIFFGVGDGTFTEAPGSPFLAPSDPTEVRLADFDGDGRVDVAVAGHDDVTMQPSGVVVVYPQVSFRVFASFSFEFPVAPDLQPTALAVGDFDGQNGPDLVVADLSAGTLNLMMNDGTGSLDPGPILNEPDGPLAVTCADFDRNGRSDIVVTLANTSKVELRLVSLAGVPQIGALLDTGADVLSRVAVGDFNGDGFVDLAAPSSNGPELVCLPGLGNGAFSPPVVTSWPADPAPAGLVSIDLDFDGRRDLVWTRPGTNEVEVALGLGTGQFTPPTPRRFTVGATPLSVGAADVSHDFLPDVVVANADGPSVSVLLQISR